MAAKEAILDRVKESQSMMSSIKYDPNLRDKPKFNQIFGLNGGNWSPIVGPIQPPGLPSAQIRSNYVNYKSDQTVWGLPFATASFDPNQSFSLFRTRSPTPIPSPSPQPVPSKYIPNQRSLLNVNPFETQRNKSIDYYINNQLMTPFDDQNIVNY